MELHLSAVGWLPHMNALLITANFINTEPTAHVVVVLWRAYLSY